MREEGNISSWSKLSLEGWFCLIYILALFPALLAGLSGGVLVCVFGLLEGALVVLLIAKRRQRGGRILPLAGAQRTTATILGTLFILFAGLCLYEYSEMSWTGRAYIGIFFLGLMNWIILKEAQVVYVSATETSDTTGHNTE